MTDQAGTTSISDPRAVSRDIFSASMGSIACCCTGQPFDTVKVRMQTRPMEFPSLLSTTGSIFRNEGVPAFWKGAVPTAAGMVAESVIVFGVHGALKRAFPDDPARNGGRPNLVKKFLMGIITGCCSALVTLPGDVVKAKTQVVVGQLMSSQQVWKDMLKRQGYKSLCVGLDAQLMRDVPFYAFFFGCYELNCYLFRTYVPSMPQELNYFLSGGFAGMLGWTACMPFDVPKTNVQSRYDTKMIGSYFPELFKIARERGFTGLYRGLGATLMRAFPVNASLFLGVEISRKFFDNWIWGA